MSIIGGGTNPKPGEVSLAHHGVLFLDELGEFSKKTLDMLRQPLENTKVTISRVHSTVTYPAKFIFIAAMNPCPCGYFGSDRQYCTCSEKQIKTYKNRISGPVLDRIDILLTLKPVNLKGQNLIGIESSKEVRKRVKAARERQYDRYGKGICNGRVSFEQLITYSPISSKQQEYLQNLSIKHGLSNRVQIKIMRLARTIADLNGEDSISDETLEEAVTLRKMDHHPTKAVFPNMLTGERINLNYK